jgi:D-alanyl-D-alanine carboxypeptidase
MKRLSALSLLLVLLLAACQALPTPTPAPAQAQPTQVQVKPTPTPVSPTAAPTQVQQQQEPALSASAQLLDKALGQKLQAALDAAVASPGTNWPGAVLYVSAPGLGTWSGAAGLGDVETKTPMRPNDRFRAGSLIKPFIATVVLQLVEEGYFGLDDPIDKLLPAEVAGKITNSDQITVRMLLNHTGGVPEFMDGAGPQIIAHPDKVWTAEEFVDFVAGQQPSFAPGKGQRYSNTDYLLLGMIIEKATGRPWREEVRQRIIEPLNLKDTLLPAPEETALPGDHAHGYADFGNGMFDATDMVTASVVGAAGGQSLVTTAPDLATFIDALLAGRLFKKAGTLDQMLTFVEFSPDQAESAVVKEYGLGLMKASYGGDLIGIGHAGDTEGGYSGFVFRFPKQEITISGAVNVLDPGAGFLNLMPPVLEALVPDHTMPELPSVQQAEAASAMQGLLDDQVQKQGILGMAMAVRLPDGSVVWRGSGTTDPAGENPWTMDTVSALGSITKSFTAVVIMQLVQEGKLSLDDTVDKWFPNQPNGDKITVRMLLSHTSGLANYISANNVMDPKWAHEWAPMDLVAEANRLGPVDKPGSSTAHYANTNYILLGMIVEKVTGNSWAQEIRSRIIEPLHLEHTTFAGEKGVWGGVLVPGYVKTPNGYSSTLELPSYPDASTSWAAGELVGSLSDLLTFATALFDGKLVSKETLAEMATPLGKDPENGVVWGLGVATLENLPGGFGNEGGIPGYSSFFLGVQGTKLAVATLLNTEGGDVIGPSLMAFDYLRSLPQAGQQPAPGDPAAAMQGLLDDQVQKQGITGMIMAARLPDGSVVSRSSGYTDPVKKTPWTMDTVSALGSVTKSFTAVVIMQLVQEGKLSLDDTINKWFPDQPNGDKITVRMLLSHTSGLGGFIPAGNESDPKWSKEWSPMDLVAEANRLGPVGKPGGSAHYSNTNYMLLGMIVEKITGNSLHEEFRSRIFEPLHLEHTAFLGDKGVFGGMLVPGYIKTSDGFTSNLDLPSLPSATIAWAVGDVVSSPADLLTFASALFDGKLVSKESLAEMATPVAKDAATGQLWGLGGGTLEEVPGGFGMGGEAVGYQAFYLGVQGTKIVVLALANTWEADVIGPSLMAFDYLRSLPPAGGQPAPGGAETPAIAPELVNRAAGWLAKEANISMQDLRLLKAEHVEWNDSCFGLGGPAESCLQAITPGWRLTAEAAGKQYEVRTDESGSAFRLAREGS